VSRLLGALDSLKECWPRCSSPELRQQILLAIASLRRPDATDRRMELVASEAEPTAIAALSALRIFKVDPRLFRRITKLVQERGSPKPRDCFDRDLGPGEP
jgi:hypothetical protein